ncbi:MAG: hypothetical protein V4596_00095 [Bdellovibrionota bacterium]
MKALISVFIALLIVVVSHYAHANDIKVTRAQNGAKDPNVQVIKEDKKSSGKITPEDLKDFSTRSYDSRVLGFQRGNEFITMIPLTDLWWSKERRQIFNDSQILAEKLMKVWLEKAFSLRFDGNQSLVEQELVNFTAGEIRKKFTDKVGGMPTRSEIISAAGDARDAAKKLQDKAKFLVEFDELIDVFNKYQDDHLQDSFVKEKLAPSAFIFVVNFKLPASFLEALPKVAYFQAIGKIINSSLNFTVTVRPWKVVSRNLNTGVITTSPYFEISAQAWALKDLKTDKHEVKGPLKLGGGLLFGNFSRMADVHGGVLGLSNSFNVKKSMLDGALTIPTHVNLSYGIIGAVLETFAGSLQLRDVLKHGYILLTKQFGYQTPRGKMFKGEYGGVVNFNAIANRFSSFDQETLNGIIEKALEIPGANVMVHNNQVEISLPEESTTVKPAQPTPAKPETVPTPVNPVP